jgi:hypothetical protein
MRVSEMEIHDYARQLFEAHGDKAIAEAAQKACAFEARNNVEQAEAWRRIEAILKSMCAPPQG